MTQEMQIEVYSEKTLAYFMFIHKQLLAKKEAHMIEKKNTIEIILAISNILLALALLITVLFTMTLQTNALAFEATKAVDEKISSLLNGPFNPFDKNQTSNYLTMTERLINSSTTSVILASSYVNLHADTVNRINSYYIGLGTFVIIILGIIGFNEVKYRSVVKPIEKNTAHIEQIICQIHRLKISTGVASFDSEKIRRLIKTPVESNRFLSNLNDVLAEATTEDK